MPVGDGHRLFRQIGAIQQDPNQTAIAPELLGTSIRLLDGELTEEIVALKLFKVVKFSGAKPGTDPRARRDSYRPFGKSCGPWNHQAPSSALLRLRRAECQGARLVAFGLTFGKS
jgi:hypothetical protein